MLLEHVQASNHMLLGAGLTDTAADKASPPNVLPVLQVHEVVWQMNCLHVMLAAAGCIRWTPACCEVSLLLEIQNCQNCKVLNNMHTAGRFGWNRDEET